MSQVVGDGVRALQTYTVARSKALSTLASRGEGSTLAFSLNCPWTGLSECESGVRDMAGVFVEVR